MPNFRTWPITAVVRDQTCRFLTEKSRPNSDSDHQIVSYCISFRPEWFDKLTTNESLEHNSWMELQKGDRPPAPCFFAPFPLITLDSHA